MQDNSPIRRQDQAGAAQNTHLLKSGLEKLEAFAARQETLRTALRELGEVRDEAARRNIARLQHQLAALEPSITVIGQVKAGKSTLINAMVGWPDLLPADVNPWTSVVSSLHVSPGAPKTPVRARFKFFDREEWDRLLDKGGRIGELASRAGAAEELEKIRLQVEHMREKSRTRLGRRFELLLGKQHEYNAFDEEVVERYVCLGDDFDDDSKTAQTQGRFADITKSADLYFQRSEFPLPLCIRDTPGVNDTFLMREQITIRAIRDSRLCVVVLSAHQALTTVDMALIRLIANIKSRDVVIFVNRIDELSDPGQQVPEIRDRIRETLREHDGPEDVEIIFGSAFWAHNALAGTLKELGTASREALLNWAESELREISGAESPLELIWQFSGVPTLYRVLSERIAQGVGKEAIERIARSTANLAKSLEAAGHVHGDDGAAAAGKLVMERDSVLEALEQIETRSIATLRSRYDALFEAYASRLDRSHRSFVERATASLVNHLERFGEERVWKYDPAGLRLLLRSAHQVFSARLNRAAAETYAETAAELGKLFGQAFGSGDAFHIEAPVPPHVPPPVVIGQTIALDIHGSWWRNWWRRRRGYQSFSTEFFSMIVAETEPIVRDLKVTQTELARTAIFAVLSEFLAEQRLTLLSLTDRKSGDGARRLPRAGYGVTSERFAAIRETIGTLMQQAA